VSIEQQQTQTQIPVIQFDTLLVLMVIKKQKPLEKKIKIVDKYFGVAPLLHAHKQNKPGPVQLGPQKKLFIHPQENRGDNRTDRVRFEFGSDRLCQFDLLEEIGSDRIRSGSDRVGSIYMLCFFKFLIDFD
jgi:hypothetical protein